MKIYKLSFLFALALTFNVNTFAQENEADIEEVVVVGSQIKGAKITGALPVSVISSEDIDSLGAESGDELLDNIAELGQNTFNQNVEDFVYDLDITFNLESIINDKYQVSHTASNRIFAINKRAQTEANSWK